MKLENVVKLKLVGGLGVGSLEVKIGQYWSHGGVGLGRKGRCFGEESLGQNMVRRWGVRFLVESLGFRCWVS